MRIIQIRKKCNYMSMYYYDVMSTNVEMKLEKIEIRQHPQILKFNRYCKMIYL